MGAMKIAVMLDLENYQPDLGSLETALERFGKVVSRRAFASDARIRWYYGDELRLYGYRLELTPGETRRWQEADHLLVETALDQHDRYDALALCSNDIDFQPLLSHLRALGKRSIVIGDGQARKLRRAADWSVCVRTREPAAHPRCPCPRGVFLRALNAALAAACRPGTRVEESCTSWRTTPH